MLGLDTNVLVRYLVRDDQLQFEKARRLIKRETGRNEPVLINLLVLLETEWVLRSRYELSKPAILAAFSALLDVADLTFEDEPSIEHALYSWKDSVADFADCLIEARNRRLGCAATVTFDTRALMLRQQAGECRRNAIEPVRPADMKRLSGSQLALARFLRIDLPGG